MMKSFFKKSAISVVVLGLSGVALAEGTPVSNPMVKPGMMGYFVGVEGLYFEPRNGDLDYVTTFPASGTTGSVDTKAISPSYDWGYRLFGGLRFGDNDDASLAWTHFHTDDSSSIGDPVNASGAVISSTLRWLGDFDWVGINAKVNFDLDDVTLVMGHTVKFNNPWKVRFAGGLEYARLDSDMTVAATDINNPVLNTDDVGYSFKSTNETRGFGPRVEFDAIYSLTDNFSLFANTSAALLIGTRDIGLDIYQPDNLPVYEKYNSSTYSERHVVIPKLGMRLGVNYAWMMGQAGGEGACSILNIDAGWEAQTYVHAIERAGENRFSGSGLAPSLTNAAYGYSSSTKTSNYSVQGLFLGINYSWM